MSGLGIVGDFAAIEIDGQGNVTLGGVTGGFLLDPIVETPPLVNDDEGRMGTGAVGQIEKGVGRGIAAGERDSLLAVGVYGEEPKHEGKRANEEPKGFHRRPLGDVDETRRQERRRGLKIFHEIGKALDRVVIVGVAGNETEIEIEAMGGGHDGWSRVEVDGLALSGGGAIENGLGESATEAEATRDGANPETLEFPGIGGNGDGERAKGNEAKGIGVAAG